LLEPVRLNASSAASRKPRWPSALRSGNLPGATISFYASTCQRQRRIRPLAEPRSVSAIDPKRTVP